MTDLEKTELAVQRVVERMREGNRFARIHQGKDRDYDGRMAMVMLREEMCRLNMGPSQAGIPPAPTGFEDWPVYRTSKIVRAAKVVGGNGDLLLLDGVGSISVLDIQGKVPPRASAIGGYVVIYKDGHKSWSPAETFEDSATLLQDKT